MHELDQLQEDIKRELNEIESLRAHNAATTGIITELSSLEVWNFPI